MRFVPLSEIEGPTYRFVPLETSQPAEPPAAAATPPVAAVAPERPALEPMAGTMAGFELPEPAEPTPVAPVAAPEKPSPYKSRIEALDDAVNFIEEGADQKQVFDAFKQLGLTQEEIIRHGQKRGSEFFQVQPAGPGVPSVEPTGRMTSFEPGVLQQSADYFKRAKTSLSDQATSFMLSTGAIIPDNILDTYVNTKKAQGDTRPDSVIRDEARADAAANLIRRNARDRAAAAPNESIQRGMEEIGSAETYGDAAKAMLRNPGTTLSMLVESLLVTTPSLAATLVLAPAGVPARVATAFVSSGAMEYASVMNDVLQDKGVDLTNAEQVSKALRDPKILEEMKEKGAKRGLIVGGFDAISMGLAGRFLRPANELIAAGKLTGQAARNATISAWSKELAMQMALGAGGEFAAQQATGDNRPADVILEGLAEGLTAPLDVRATLRQTQAMAPEAQIARAIEAGVAETEFTPEGIRREGAAAAAGLRPTTVAELAAAMPEVPSVADLAPSPGEPSFGDLAPAPGRAEPSLGAATVVGGRPEPRLGPPPEPPAPTTPVVEPPVTPVTAEPAVTPVTTKPAVTPVTTRTVPTIPGMPTGEEIEEEPVTPVTAPVTPVTAPRVEPVEVASFTTEKGSTYEVTPEGQTIRTKRSPGRGQGTTYEPHTVLYVTPDNLIDIQSDLSSGMGENSVRLGYVADNKFMPAITPADIPEGAKTVVGVFNRDSNAVVGIYPAVNTPEVGLHPIEKLYMPDGKSSTHLGNKIVEITPVTPVTKGDFKPTQAAARLPDIPTVAPLVAPKTFEPPPVGLEASGVPTVEVPLGDLRLSNDVPQFKLGATAEGIVEPLGGKFERVGVAPIQVWRRLDGSLEVISGRHRFDLAKRSGETTIPAQIHDEAKGFNRLQASILDAELNIRDGQGKVKDYVNYFKESGITKQDADARGLLARATGKRSFTIATQGSDELIAAVRADQIGDEAAFYIALNAPNDARLQGVGIKAIQDGKSMNTATNMMQAVKALAGETDTTLDMFGFDDSAIREAEEMAKIAAQKQREIQTRLSAISGAAKNPALAKAEGIDVRDPEAIKRRIEELKQRKAAWDNWSTSPDLVAEIRQARGVAPPAPTIVEAPPAGPSLFDEDLLTAPTPDDIRAREEAAAKRAREAAEAERKAKADEARGDFVLTGSDRAADEAAARGQMELGAQPEPGTTVDENDPGFRGASDEEVKDVADAFKNAAERQDADKVTRVLDAPNKGEIVRIENKAKIFVKDAGYLTVAQAKQRIAEWKNNAQSQGEDRRNSEKIVLSLFDMTGEWSKPWEEAGYQVYRFDIQTDPEFGDVNKFSSEFFNDMYGAFEGQDVYAILAACPCTDFASSGARHFAAKDADGRTVESVELVQQTLATIEYFKPSVWAIENPVGRIEKLTGLPPWRMSFNPNHFGDPYTKKTLLWGRFNADLPIAPVEPTEGSKMHRMYGGKSQETKNARSVTPEGFAYAFFQANNAIDNPVMAIANKYDMMDPGVFREALAAGMSEKQISDIVDDPYYFYQDYRAANKALMDAVAELDVAPAAPAAKEPENIRLARKELKESEREPGKELTPAQLKRRRELIEYEKAQGVTGVTADTVVNNQAPPADLPAENRLVLMPCCAKKGDKKAPAMELYKGVFFQSFASNVKPGAQPNVIILSAKHGFIDPTQEIEPYDQVMTPTRAKEMLDNMGAELAKVTWPTNIQDVLVVGGKEYQQVMRAALADLVNSGQIPKTASINVTSGGIGEQRQQLNSYLQAIPAAEPEAAPEKEQYTPEQRKQAENHAEDLGGEIVWQRGDNALIRGYSLLSGDPIYAATVGDTRTRIDIEAFTGKMVPDDVKQEMIAVKKRLEAEAIEKHNAAPFITFQDGLAMSQDIPEQLAGVIKEWKSLLKLDVPIYISTIQDARANRNNFTGPHRRIGSGTLKANELGSMRAMPDSSYYILFDKSTSPTKMLETIAHEMGHVHQRLFYDRASQAEKDALRDAHKKWLESQKGKTAREMIDSMRARSTGRAVRVRPDMPSDELSSYWSLFSEWYADQTARWAVSSARPVTIVEKYFKRLGNQLRRFFQQLKARKYLPDETFAQYIEQVTSRPANIEPRPDDRAERMAIPLENIPPKQMGFGFEDTEATDFIAQNNPVVAETLSQADRLPGAKKKLPPGRSPELAEAARQLKAGQITAAEFDALVNRYRPIAVYTEPLKPASDKQMYDALDVAKRGKINPSISDGYPVGLRLDIPAFNRAGVYVVTIHEKRTPSSPGKAIGYTSVAAVRNATFGVGNQQAALRIATGEAKDALQTIEGLYTPITPEEAYRRAEEALKSKDWVQVGIDPTRHSYFYDRKTTRPVLKADEIIQIGNMVLAKGVTYGNKSDFLFSPEIDRAEAEGLAVGTTREEQIKEYSALRRRLAGVVKKVVEGKVDIDVQRNTTDMMQRSRELQAAIKASKPRIDTPEAFLAKALQEYDKGNIEKDVLDVVQAAYSKQPELLNGLLLSVRKEQGEAAGRFDPFRRVVFLFKQTSGVYAPATIRHELAHSLEQMMTPEQRVAVVQAWGKALARAIKQNPDKLHQRYFNAVLDFLESPSVRSFRKAQSLLPSYEMYQFINPSEYWAVNAEKLMAAQLGTAWDRFKKAVRQLFEGLKKVLGFDNRYEVHKVFSQVIGGSKERLDRESLVDLVTDTDGSAFVTLNNIEDADKILKKYNRPNTPQNDTTPLATFVTKQFKSGKEAFTDMVENPKEATVGAYNYVSDGLTKFRIENIFFGAGLEKRDFERYGGQLRTSDKLITASVALDNAIRGGNIAVEVISRGGIEYNDKFGNFVAVKTDMGMAGVYRAEKKLKDDLGDQRGTDIINGYFEAKRSISIVDEFNERSKQLAAATSNYNVLKAAGGDPDAVAQAKAAMDAAREDVESIKKAVSSVTMSEEEMYEFAALEDTYPELRDMMDNWTAINQNLLQMWRQVGLLSQGRYETLSAIKDYVPWYRIMDDSADIHDPVQSTTRTFVNIGREKLFKRGKPVARFDMRATAGQKEFNVPASSVVKIKVNDKAVDPKKVLLSPDGKIILDVDLQENDLVTFETVREIQNIVDNMTRNVMRMTMNGLRQFAQNRIVLEYATRNAKDKIQTYSTVDPALNRFNWTSNGKKVVVEIADPLVAAAVYGLEPVNFGKALGAMFKASEMAANILRRSITLSGAFQIKQVFKDAPTAAIVTGVRNPFALIGGVWKGFLTSLTNTDPVVDILKSAGIGGYMSPARTPEAELKRRMGIMNRNVFSFVIKGLDHIGDSADMAQRVAVYKRVLAETGDQGQALYQAANVINYLRRGKAGYAQAIVKLTPFMGAYANATDVLLQTLMLRGLKGQTRAKLAGRLLATTGALSVVTLLYAMLAGADPEYDEVDDQTKLRNIFIPGTEIMLPMNTSAAYIFKVMPELLYMNLIRQSTESKMDERRLRRALGEAAKDMLLGPEPVPAGLKPLLEVGVNRSFYTGRDIVPENMQKLEPFMQFTASTSELAKKLGEYTNMSPMNIDHLVRGLFGSVGAMAQWASNSMAVAVGERPEPTRREAPVVGGFLRPELPRGREDLYYDFKKDVLEKYTTYDRMLKQENFDEAEKYFNKHAKLIEMYDYINEIDEGLQEVNQEIQRIALSKAKITPPQERHLESKKRRSEITELQKIKRDVVDSVLDFRKDVYGLSSLVRQPAK